MSVITAEYVNKDPKMGVQVVIANKEQMAMPFTIEIVLKDGTKQRISVPVETWMNNKNVVVTFPTTTEAESVTVDPDKALPDINRKNNTFIVK